MSAAPVRFRTPSLTGAAPRPLLSAVLAALLLGAGVRTVEAQQPATAAAATMPAADPADVRSIDAIIGALYDVISGPAGQKRDWNRMRSLFIPGARLIPVRPDSGGGSSARVLSVDDYIGWSGPYLEKNGFFEREIGRRTEVFGNIAHVFSAYDSKHTAADPQPFARGINSIQLQRDGDRWWVVTIMWDAERPGLTIPPEYLSKP